jgi:hypothetical protein
MEDEVDELVLEDGKYRFYADKDGTLRCDPTGSRGVSSLETRQYMHCFDMPWLAVSWIINL